MFFRVKNTEFQRERPYMPLFARNYDEECIVLLIGKVVLYFTHERQVFERDGQWLAAEPCIQRKPTEQVVTKQVRCRTIGDITCTGLTLSKAHTLEDIIEEIAATRVTERGGRADDKRSETSMEDRKKAGYF